MDRAGVASQVIAATPQVLSLPDPTHALHASRLVNDEYARIIDTYSGRFNGYGALPSPHVDEALKEIPRIFDELGFVGVSLPTMTIASKQAGPQFLDEPALDAVWEALNDYHAIVNIHPTGYAACSPMLSGSGLTWVNGAPVEDATAVLQLLKADVVRRFPQVRFHVAHLGGDVPFIAQRIEENFEDWQAFAHSPLEQLRTMYFGAANFHEPSLILAAETFGAAQLLAGSDFPYFQREKYLRAFDYIRGSRLSQEDIEVVLSGNAARLYGY